MGIFKETDFVRRSPEAALKAAIYSLNELADVVEYGSNRFYIPGYGFRLPEHYKRDVV